MKADCCFYCIDKDPKAMDVTLKISPSDSLGGEFCVWIDTNMGCCEEYDWEINSTPKSVVDALQEAIEVQQQGFPCLIVVKGKTPRTDGEFTNPETN